MCPVRTRPRLSGLILHPTSLPGRFGIGELGGEARRFVDFLAASGQQLWQMLPLGPPDPSDWYSPYSALSAFAGNPLLISLESLREQGLLEAEVLEDVPALPEERVDFPRVAELKGRLLARAAEAFFQRASPALRQEFERFREASRAWLEDYALFMALREEQGRDWSRWEAAPRQREPAALEEARRRLAGPVRLHEYLQFEFYRQWRELKRYANERGLRIVGDLPIYVGHDSADVWAHPEYFQLSPETGRPAFEAGVPPDGFFSDEGQRWGNPVYDWERLARDDYRWWAERLRQSFRQFDSVRLDHFRGFEAYWVIPAGAPSAKAGHWEKGPGAGFFEAMRRHLGELPLIVEDLGFITPEVHALRESFDFPGMSVLQFAFGEEDSMYLPHECRPDFVMYTGTHDTETTVGWFQSLPAEQRKAAVEYVGTLGAHGVHWDMLRVVWASVAQWALAPLQDVMGLGSEGRMNRPGVGSSDNWSWRFRWEWLTDESRKRLLSLTRTYGRTLART
ncbi:MAG TPA: 4-alpha-glucanotransferase [Myxococcaceae bacterium]|nr:4-alpha-glucanotransferase [Myxococcaceae bacterium]